MLEKITQYWNALPNPVKTGAKVLGGLVLVFGPILYTMSEADKAYQLNKSKEDSMSITRSIDQVYKEEGLSFKDVQEKNSGGVELIGRTSHTGQVIFNSDVDIGNRVGSVILEITKENSDSGNLTNQIKELQREYGLKIQRLDMFTGEEYKLDSTDQKLIEQQYKRD